MDVQSIIDRAGGIPKLMDKLGVARTTILGWKASNTIPAARVAQISHELKLPSDELLPLASQPRAQPEPQGAI
jgi:hypothetical protein